MGASSKFFKSLISGKRGGGGGGVIVAPSVPTKALPDTTKAPSTAGSEKAVSEKAPSELSHQSEKDDVVLVSIIFRCSGTFLLLFTLLPSHSKLKR